MVFKLLNVLAPQYMCSLFTINSACSSYNFRDIEADSRLPKKKSATLIPFPVLIKLESRVTLRKKTIYTAMKLAKRPPQNNINFPLKGGGVAIHISPVRGAALHIYRIQGRAIGNGIDFPDIGFLQLWYKEMYRFSRFWYEI